MATWAGLIAEVVVWTNRPELQAETLASLKNAVRAAHKSGKYFKDLALYAMTSISTDSATGRQSVDLSALSSQRIRSIAYVKRSTVDVFLTNVGIDDLVDSDGYTRNGVYWVVGSTLYIRDDITHTALELAYYSYPNVSDATNMVSWIVDGDHKDLVVLLAAAFVLGMVGEQEIKSRVETLAAAALQDLREDNIEAYGR